MTVRSYLLVLRKRWRVVVAATLVALAAAVGITLAMPVTYAATATSFVAIQRASDDQTSLYQTSQFAMQRVASYTSVVDSPAVLQPVMASLDLQGDLTDLRKNVTADNPADTVLLQVTAQAASPALAARIANAVSTNLGREVERLESPKAGGVSPVKVSLSVPATAPTSPVSPRRTLNLALGLLAGLALGVALAVVRDAQDTSISDSDLAELTGRSPLGFVGYNPAFASDPLLVLDQTGPSTEEFRTIRTNLQFTDVDHPPRGIVVTSAVPSEGKSTVACNLALTLARSHRVCLVEADLRRPKVAEYLGVDGTVGLSNVLAGQHDLDDALVPWRRGLLTVLPAGTEPPDPSQLLASRTMESVHEQLAERFDYVVFDAPPVLPVSDAMVLASATDGVIFVSRHGSTKRALVERALEQLATVHTRLVGTVLTFVPARSHRAVRGHAYGYGYSSSRPPVPTDEVASHTEHTEPAVPALPAVASAPSQREPRTATAAITTTATTRPTATATATGATGARTDVLEPGTSPAARPTTARAAVFTRHVLHRVRPDAPGHDVPAESRHGSSAARADSVTRVS